MGKAQSAQVPRLARAPPQGAPGSSGWLGAPTGETSPPGAQPLPRLLELAADVTAFAHARPGEGVHGLRRSV